MNVMDDKLIEFLNKRISQFKELETLAEAVMAVKSPNALGDTYRKLIEQVNEAWEAVDKTDRKNNKTIKHDPGLQEDSRVAWFNAVYSALQKASTHSRPPVNSHQLDKNFTAAYEIQTDLSFCRYELERKLAEIEKS